MCDRSVETATFNWTPQMSECKKVSKQSKCSKMCGLVSRSRSSQRDGNVKVNQCGRRNREKSAMREREKNQERRVESLLVIIIESRVPLGSLSLESVFATSHHLRMITSSWFVCDLSSPLLHPPIKHLLILQGDTHSRVPGHPMSWIKIVRVCVCVLWR